MGIGGESSRQWKPSQAGRAAEKRIKIFIECNTEHCTFYCTSSRRWPGFLCNRTDVAAPRSFLPFGAFIKRRHHRLVDLEFSRGCSTPMVLRETDSLHFKLCFVSVGAIFGMLMHMLGYRPHAVISATIEAACRHNISQAQPSSKSRNGIHRFWNSVHTQGDPFIWEKI